VAYTLAQNCMSYFKIACDMVQEGQKPNNTMVQSSNADELRKFKELLDDGIITEEEFRVKKKQLLGL
ncbi:SHOCT domain-containing protein, partial [Eisenbergiella tayi]